MAPRELVSMVVDRWDLGAVRQVRRITGGEWNDVWRLSTARGDFVARLSNPQLTIDSVQWEHALLRRIAPSTPVVVAPIADRSGETLASWQGRVVTLFPFVPGRVPEQGELAPAATAKTLAELHRVLLAPDPEPPRPGQASLAELDWNTNHMWDWRVVQDRLKRRADASEPAGDTADGVLLEAIASHAPFIAAERERMAEWVQQTARCAALTGVVHGDFFRGNVLIRNGEVVAVVDWDESHPDWMAYELGWSAWEFCHRGSRLDTDAFRGFVQAYREQGGPVPADEDELLLPSVRCRHLIEVLWALGRGVFDAGYCLQGIEALKHLPMGDVPGD